MQPASKPFFFHPPKPISSRLLYTFWKVILSVFAVEDEEIKQIYIDVFLESGRVSNLTRVLALHPSYFVKYYTTFNFIMRDDGPLSPDWRNYIAILVIVWQS